MEEVKENLAFIEGEIVQAAENWSTEADKQLWKTVKCQGKVMEKSGNFEIQNIYGNMPFLPLFASFCEKRLFSLSRPSKYLYVYISDMLIDLVDTLSVLRYCNDVLSPTISMNLEVKF